MYRYVAKDSAHRPHHVAIHCSSKRLFPGIVAFVAYGTEVLDVDVEAQMVYLQTAQPFLWEGVPQRDVFYAEVGSVFNKAVGDNGMLSLALLVVMRCTLAASALAT